MTYTDMFTYKQQT